MHVRAPGGGLHRASRDLVWAPAAVLLPGTPPGRLRRALPATVVAPGAAAPGGPGRGENFPAARRGATPTAARARASAPGCILPGTLHGARGRCYAGRVPEVLAALDAFVQEHRRCGDLEGGVEEGWVRLRCECGAELVRRADEQDWRRGLGALE